MNDHPCQLCYLCRRQLPGRGQGEQVVTWPGGRSITVCPGCHAQLMTTSDRDRIPIWQACNKMLNEVSITLLGRGLGGGKKG